jgi:N-acetylmuramic acid 6-phosphate etherase
MPRFVKLLTEDNATQAWIDLQAFNINSKDVGNRNCRLRHYSIRNSGLQACNENNIITGSISCNAGSPLSQTAQFPVDVVVGPEFVTGSSRMKAGTAQS